MLLAALVLRLLFIGADGFKNDVSTFESWALTLSDHPLRQFFANAGFADYPPGYFFVLWIVGHAYRLLVHNDPTYGALKIAVKLPAILMDLVDAALIFALVRRFSSTAWAFVAAAFFAFNPAAIFISAYWGQVDSVAGGMTLASLLLLVAADGRSGRVATSFIIAAWLLLGYSVLIKPPALVLVPLFMAYVYASDGSRRADQSSVRDAHRRHRRPRARLSERARIPPRLVAARSIRVVDRPLPLRGGSLSLQLR